MRRCAVVFATMMMAWPAVAGADPPEASNVTIGPVFAHRFGGPRGDRLIVGVEGGVGAGAERINVGVTGRLGKRFAYLEIDPWFALGASLGVGVDSDGVGHPVVGVWEGVPLAFPGCEAERKQTDAVLTISFGYRYTGVHELYVTPKIGAIDDGKSCLD